LPDLIRSPGAAVIGAVVEGLSETDLARIDFYEAVFGRRRDRIALPFPEGEEAVFWRGDASLGGPEWRINAWSEREGPLAVAVAGDVMALRGEVPPEEVARRYRLMDVRGASRLRATGGGTEVRRAAVPEDVRVARRRQPYAHFFAVEEYDLRFRRFDGGESGEINRAAFISGDAVTVLPYDPWRDRVLLIEQFRAGPFARGDDQPWQLEAIAGRIDPGETAEETARREAREEAGLDLGELLAVASYYPSPGAKSEFLYSFCALTDLPDGCAGTFGLAEEAEDIRGHLVPFDRLMALVESGEAGNAPLILTALWLQRERPRLRAAYSR
jgi:nudix-type nucleoside diphosphatase (YffH/AdpP family)